jgi:hypothetical protein
LFTALINDQGKPLTHGRTPSVHLTVSEKR